MQNGMFCKYYSVLLFVIYLFFYKKIFAFGKLKDKNVISAIIWKKIKLAKLKLLEKKFIKNKFKRIIKEWIPSRPL